MVHTPGADRLASCGDQDPRVLVPQLMLPLPHRGPHGFGGPADAVGSCARERSGGLERSGRKGRRGWEHNRLCPHTDFLPVPIGRPRSYGREAAKRHGLRVLRNPRRRMLTRD